MLRMAMEINIVGVMAICVVVIKPSSTSLLRLDFFMGVANLLRTVGGVLYN